MTVVIRGVSVCAPLGCHAAGFAAELARQGYTPLSIRTQLRLVAHVSRWLNAEGLDLAALTPAAVQAFVCSRLAAGSTACVSPKEGEWPRASQPQALAEPYVTVSRHTAPTVRS
jgi:hypothetical protein